MKLLRPKSDLLETQGRVSYHEKSQSWSMIRLHKVILDKFPQLRNKSSIITFKIEFCGSYDSLIRKVVELKEKDGGIPLLLYLYQE